jgi:predicted transcriptional regulator
MEAGDLKKLEIAADNTRFKLLGLLVKQESYATKLSRQLKVKRKTIAFQLKQLENLGLVHGKYMTKRRRG